MTTPLQKKIAHRQRTFDRWQYFRGHIVSRRHLVRLSIDDFLREEEDESEPDLELLTELRVMARASHLEMQQWFAHYLFNRHLYRMKQDPLFVKWWTANYVAIHCDDIPCDGLPWVPTPSYQQYETPRHVRFVKVVRDNIGEIKAGLAHPVGYQLAMKRAEQRSRAIGDELALRCC